MSSYSWTEDLIDQVLQQPALINPSHLDYRNLAKRESIWEEVAERLGTTSEEVKKRWRSLRDSYGRYVRRQRQSMGSGKVKKWFWADKMEPLRSHMTASSDFDSLDLLPDADGGSCSENTTDSAIEDQKATSTENIKSDFVYDPIVPEVMLATTTGSKRKFVEQQQSAPVHWEYYEDDRRSKMDPLDLLLLAHAGTIRTFSGKRQAITKLKIAEVIMEQELLHQEEMSEN